MSPLSERKVKMMLKKKKKKKKKNYPFKINKCGGIPLGAAGMAWERLR